MVKTPRTRHAKSRRSPLTIELGADEVARLDEPARDVADPEPIPAETAASSDEEAFQDRPSAETVAEQPVPEETKAEDATPASSDTSFGRREPAEERPQPAMAPRRSGGGMSSLAAGLIGAVIALGGMLGLQAAGLLPVPGGDAASLAPLQSDVASLRGEVEALAGVGDAAPAIAELRSELATLKSAVESGGAGDGAAVAALDSKIKQLEASVGSGVPPQVVERLDGLEGKVAAATDVVTKTDGRIAALEQRVTDLTGKVDQQASQPKVALAIAASALKSAVDRGGPFAAEVETFAAIAPNAPELAALRKYSEAGIATEADLVAAFPESADAMMAADKPEDPNAGVFQRLMDSAQSMVKVRPVGAVTGEDAGARIARMEVALKAGDLPQAVVEYDALPDPVKTAGAALADRIKARIEVTKLVDHLVAGAMKAA